MGPNYLFEDVRLRKKDRHLEAIIWVWKHVRAINCCVPDYSGFPLISTYKDRGARTLQHEWLQPFGIAEMEPLAEANQTLEISRVKTYETTKQNRTMTKLHPSLRACPE